MLERWMPYGSAAFNPVFRFGIRRLRFGRSAQTLDCRSWMVIVVASVVTLVLWGFALAGKYASMACSMRDIFYCYYPLVDVSAAFAAGLAAFSVGFDLFLDMASLLAGYQTLRLEAEATHWDLLRLTPMRLEVLVDAHHAVAQTRAWLLTVLVTTFRVGAVVLFLVSAFVLPLILRGNIGDLGLGYDFSWLFAVTGLAVTAVIFMIEPLWRMRAVTALGIALATRFRQPAFGALAGLGSIMALWLVQWIIFGIMLAITFSIGRYSFVCAPPFGGALGAVVIWLFYRTLNSRSLTRAVRDATPR